MDTGRPPDDAAAVIIGQRVCAGSELAYDAWQRDLNSEASKYPGFLAAEVTPPTAVQPDWVTIYRFDSVAHVQAWLNSATRQCLLDEGKSLTDGPCTQQVLGGARRSDPLVTVVVTHRVRAEDVLDFLAWQERLRIAEGAFTGFRGSEIFRPVDGVQDEWTTMYRFENAVDLDRWLISKERRALLAEGAKFSDFHLRTIDNSFGSWFAFEDNGSHALPPSETKTSVAVWVGLYPTVALLTLLTAPLHMPMWLDMLVGNLLGSFVMSFFTMPYYVNPLLKHWLAPPPNVPKAKSNWRGLGIVAIAMGVWTLVIYLITDGIWHLT